MMKCIIFILFLLTFNNAIAEGCEASWYGGSFNGRLTASGKRFNTNSMMAAHKTLPFGTKVRVTNKANGKSTTVLIFDRGPYIKGRCIDLSHAAKSAIGMGGTAKVNIEIVK